MIFTKPKTIVLILRNRIVYQVFNTCTFTLGVLTVISIALKWLRPYICLFGTVILTFQNRKSPCLLDLNSKNTFTWGAPLPRPPSRSSPLPSKTL